MNALLDAIDKILAWDEEARRLALSHEPVSEEAANVAAERLIDAIDFLRNARSIHEAADLRANVSRFHAAMGMSDPERPCVPSDDVVRLRAKLLVEELFETLRAMFDSSFGDIEADLNHDIANRAVRVNLPECAWRFCARATNGAHNQDKVGTCKDCGKPAITPK